MPCCLTTYFLVPQTSGSQYPSEYFRSFFKRCRYQAPLKPDWIKLLAGVPRNIVLFHFLFWNSFKLTEKLQDEFKEFQYISFTQSLQCYHFFTFALLFSLPSYLPTYLSQFFSELFKSMLQVRCPFTPKYFHICFLKKKDILCN